MNALTTHTPGTGVALVPTNLRDAMDLASMMAKGRLVPQALQNSPSDCLLVIEQAARWGMSPFAVAQEVSVIQGKLMHSGKIVAAAVQSCGILSGRLIYTYDGEGDARSVTVRGRLAGEDEPAEVTVRLKDARTSNQHWAKSPDQMLAYHAVRVWARRYAPEVMLGVYSPEEFDAPTAETRDVPNNAETPPPALSAPASGYDNPNAAKSSLWDLLDDQLSQFTDVEEINAYLQQPGVQKNRAKVEKAGKLDRWAEITGRHYSRVMQAASAEDEPEAEDAA